MKVVVAGGSGMLGRHLIPGLAEAGHSVVLLSRSGDRKVAPARTVRWQPRGGGPHTWREEVRTADAVLNLCGESVGRWPWTAGRKRALRDSRLLPTRALVDAMSSRSPGRPRTFLSMSGSDVYEGRDAQPATEDTPPVDTFLARLALDWESEAMRASASGVRVVVLRTSPVIVRGALSLARLALPFRLWLGGRIGSGRQWMSWVDMSDFVGICLWALGDEGLHGPVNVSAPDPRSQVDYARELGRALHRPAWFATPALLVRLVLGEQSTLILGSRRVWPARAMAAGYAFRRPILTEALASALSC